MHRDKKKKKKLPVLFSNSLKFLYKWILWQSFHITSLGRSSQLFASHFNEFTFRYAREKTPIWNGRGCSSEILHQTPKGDQSGCGLSFLWPLKGIQSTKKYNLFFLFFFVCYPKRYLYSLKYCVFSRNTLSNIKHQKFAPLSETRSIPVCFIWESPRGVALPSVKDCCK